VHLLASNLLAQRLAGLTTATREHGGFDSEKVPALTSRAYGSGPPFSSWSRREPMLKQTQQESEHAKEHRTAEYRGARMEASGYLTSWPSWSSSTTVSPDNTCITLAVNSLVVESAALADKRTRRLLRSLRDGCCSPSTSDGLHVCQMRRREALAALQTTKAIERGSAIVPAGLTARAGRACQLHQ
jgi:hypothetical protein